MFIWRLILKILRYIFLLIIILILQGCAFDDPMYIHFEKKNSPNYYLTEIASNLGNSTPYTLELFDTNLYKTIPIAEDEGKIIKNFIQNLTSDSYETTNEIPEKEVYQLRITFDNGENYIFKIYNESIVTVYPWDGIFSEDIVDMKNVPQRYNLYDFCTYIKNKQNHLM